MRPYLPLTLCIILLISACSRAPKPFVSPQATARVLESPIQCVPFARTVSGIEIYGNAHTWWAQAQRLGYRRGHTPKPGAVLVLSRTRSLPHGHVAVVRSVEGPREITVTHSNWGNDRSSRRYLYEKMRVQDISTKNDWSRLKFWNEEINDFGLPYKASGFIYP